MHAQQAVWLLPLPCVFGGSFSAAISIGRRSIRTQDQSRAHGHTRHTRHPVLSTPQPMSLSMICA